MKALTKTYIQVNIMDFYKFINDADLSDRIRDHLRSHHCSIYNKNNCFVFERFFPSDEIDCVEYDEPIIENDENKGNDLDDVYDSFTSAEQIYSWIEETRKFKKPNIQFDTLMSLKRYLISQGYEPYKSRIEITEAKDSSIVPGYAGVLIDLDW